MVAVIALLAAALLATRRD
ncbi:PGF-CTERM sorting domain-containing protein [Haloplanus litoreus]